MNNDSPQVLEGRRLRRLLPSGQYREGLIFVVKADGCIGMNLLES
jgi:hypothetical protein